MGLKDQVWFEMGDLRRRFFGNAVWIPLRASLLIEEIGKHDHEGFREEYFGAASLAIPVKSRKDAEDLKWGDTDAGYHSGRFQDGVYTPSDIYRDDEFDGLHMALKQRGNSLEYEEWHFHQDVVITLGIKREGDVWIRPDEDYIEVAKLRRDSKCRPTLLEIRAAHLRDYLCARDMALRIVSYRQRVEIVADAGHIQWTEKGASKRNATDRWEGRVAPIHEGGMPYGAKTAVFHVARTDVDPKEDVPSISGPPTDENIKSESWTVGDSGRKLFRISGELWRQEWVEPAAASPIVRWDKVPPTVFFIADSEGKQENRDTLTESGKWLWFRPDVISALAHRRGGGLNWYTRDTGAVACSPDYAVHFGVNELGLVNAYAKDIVLLPDWQQRVWAGFNVRPEGGVSAELLASQVNVDPADTQAPEEFLAQGLIALQEVSRRKFGIDIIRSHEDVPKLLVRAHRFRATDKNGLFALAKDLARLIADSIDASEIQKIAKPPKDTKWGSLKSLEHLLATIVDAGEAHSLLGPLFGIYDLRRADAHLASHDQKEALALAGVDWNAPFIFQGYQMLKTCVDALFRICRVIEDSNAKTKGV